MVEYIENELVADISAIVEICPDFVNLSTLNTATFQDLRESIEDDLVFSDIVTVYLNSAENLLADIQLSFTNQDIGKLGLSAHSLKSMSASIGANKLSQICRYLEKVAKTGKLTFSAQILTMLSDEYEEVIKRIQTTIIEFMAE